MKSYTTMEHLIANTGIHFITKEIEFNPSEPLLLSSGKALKYSFCDTTDFIEHKRVFDLLYYNNEEDVYIPVSELAATENAVVCRSNGREEIDEAGMITMEPDYKATLFSTYKDDDEGVINISSLQSFRVKDPVDDKTQIPAFERLLDKWLPMPMFYKEADGITSDVPKGWCRMKMQKTGNGKRKGNFNYRLIWAFDTELGANELSVFRPFISEYDNGSADFCLCNKASLLLDFISSNEMFHSFSDYIASLLGIDLEKENSRYYKAFYIYFINFIRLSGGAPEVSLHNNKKKEINVDLVLDIGNSRTCGVLFEEGEFTRGKMLELRDLSEPWKTYENKTFDMRIVFRKTDFGNDIVLEDEEMFRWKSFVRVGEEARRLVYKSIEDEGISEKTTNYSSPKRYLWDTKKYDGQWENLISSDDPFNILLSNDISIPGLSNLFDDDGTYKKEGDDKADKAELLDFEEKENHYSRSSLMTFTFIEIFQQAIMQVNSIKYRQQWGNVDCRRNIRNVIITCPTAMPLREQIILRQSAANAYEALTRCLPGLGMAEITPSATSLKITDEFADTNKRVWSYDEASCCQLVYLYAEIAQRYSGEIDKFFELKGHVRKELKEEGYEGNALTIGTVDIGAGTTDVMVCSYECDGKGQSRIVPTPLFWDSFYLAGDDILRNLVQNIVIEGKHHENADLGNISSALTARIVAMSDQELLSLPCLENIVYKNKVNDIIITIDDDEKKDKKIAFASNLVHDFFGVDSSMMSFKDRRCRNDFNTQISVPIAQRMLELLRTHRPSKLYTFDDFFGSVKPAQYLLEYFERHFGFRFEQLNWRYDPFEIGEIVKATMEPLMKQLALVLYAQHCDIIVLAGRPTSLDVITELFIKYVPVSPDRLVRLNEYRVGSWFPTADGQGYFYDQKAIVAVGGMVGYAASHTGLKGLVIDFSKMIKKMKSTANYIGEYNSRRQQVEKSILSPSSSTASLHIPVFPAFIGCKQLDSPIYQARPLYAIYNRSKHNSLNVTISRNFYDDKEELKLEEVTDAGNNTLPKGSVELVQQSLVDDGKYWLDKGEFELSIR
ncbi:MAG: virulence factor SrfB [Prevotellaceae bacterium]|nr:virulence factor SrfB [Prevotellaceae bacterium]